MIIGKPLGDVYVDDRAINPLPVDCMLAEMGMVLEASVPDEFIAAQLQFQAVHPRSFHKIELTDKFCIKSGQSKTVGISSS
jgi:hypothetical protein